MKLLYKLLFLVYSIIVAYDCYAGSKYTLIWVMNGMLVLVLYLERVIKENKK